MKNQFSRYVVIDAGQRNVLLVTHSLEVAAFVQRSIMDTRLAGIPPKNQAESDALINTTPAAQLTTLSYAAGTLVRIENPEVSDITKEKHRRAGLLTQGYATLLWYANAAGERYAFTDSIEFADLPLLATNRQEFIDLYARTRGVSQEHAAKQIEFDEQSLRAMVMRRREILWTYTPTLLTVNTQAELEAWITTVRNDTVNVGAV